MHAGANALGLAIAPTVKVGGSKLPDAASDYLVSVEVETSVHLPGMAVLVFDDDPTTSALTAANATIGSPIEVLSSGRDSSTESSLITAEITSIEAEFGPSGVRTVVRAYEKSHRLHLGRKTKTFQNVADSDIASQIAQGAGLTTGTIDATSVQHVFVNQVDQTDWEFLDSRARVIGYEFGVSDGKFYFRKPIEASTGPSTDTPASAAEPAALELEYGHNLVALDVRVTAAGQAPDVEVRAWDPKQKQALKSTQSSATTEAKVRDTPAALAGKVSGKTVVDASMPLSTQAEVDAVAKGLAADVASTFVECEGTALGEANLAAGKAVRITNVGPGFKGQYTLTRVRHVFAEDGYLTHFEMSGRRDRSLLGLVSGGRSRQSTPTLGVVVGQVTQNDDPDKLGRVKVKMPWLDEQYESDWVRVAQLGAGPNSGAVWLPEKDDEVLLAFEFGDPRRPYVLSSLWNGVDKPMEGDGLFDNGKVKRRGFVSRLGHKLIFFDDSSKKGIGMVSSDGKLKLSLNETNGEIKIHAGGKVTIITESGGDVSVQSAGKVEVKAQGDATIEAQGNANIKGTGGVKIEASGQVEVSGAMIKLG